MLLSGSIAPNFPVNLFDDVIWLFGGSLSGSRLCCKMFPVLQSGKQRAKEKK